MHKYNHKKIEKHWQKKWQEEKLYQVDLDKAKKPFYNLMMFPYPSAEGLHVGNMYAFVHSDAYGRFMKLRGYDVFEPIGLDGFGIHSENYAIKIGEHIKDVSARTEKHFYQQLHQIGNAYDWSRTVETYKPNYYKWTQWLFLKMYEKGLAYRKKSSVNWCPSCKTVLSDEQVISGKCERCDTETEKKQMEQWFWRITDYAEKLLKNLDVIDWSEEVKTIQRNWIGKSEGASVKFQIPNSKLQTNSKSQIPNNEMFEIEVFTTRPDTLFGATYFVLSPEHPLVEKITTSEQKAEVEKYIKKITQKSDLERTDLAKEKTGVFTGAYAINPVNDEKIPAWIADYVLMSYGTGAIMAVPAHDERDFEFAKKYGLPIRQVVLQKAESRKQKAERNCLIIHGSPDRDKRQDKDYIPENISHWKGWLKKKLEDNNYKVYNPQMPTPWRPDYEEWKKQVDSLDINENSVIIGHSAGGTFAVRWLSESKKKIDKLILVVAAKTATNGIKRLHDFCNFKIDQETKNRVNKIIIFVSDNEKKNVIKSAKLYQKELDGELRILKNRGHFTVGDNPVNKEFPELLDEILKAECFTGEGINIDSEFIDSLETKEAIKKMNKWLENKGVGKGAVNYKLRDWCISRQRYWGPPIPMIYCENCAKENKDNVFILHGWEASSKSDFIPSLKDNLNFKGYNAFAFDAPDTDAPYFEKWFKFAEAKIKKNSLENLDLIGHSMGALLALKLAEKYKVKKLVLVAPVGLKSSEEYFNQFKNELTKEEMEVFKKYQDRDINIDKIKKNAKEIIFVFGKKDPWITKEIRDFYIEKFKDIAQIHILEDKGHMSEGEGVKKVEFLEDLFQEVEKSETGWISVPEKDLPVELPEMDDFLPDGSGKGPLNKIKKFVNTTCPKCKGPAKRETDVSDPFVDSSWYFIRYPCTEFSDKAMDKKRLKKWMPVDMYIGGKEHGVLHLLYSRFVTMVMHDLGYVPEQEPYKQFRAHGLLISKGAKISKSKDNIVNPDEYIDKFGADAVRMYLMFIGDMRQGGAWRDSGMAGMYRFVNRVYSLAENLKIQDTRNNNQTNYKSQITNNKQISNNKSQITKLLHKTIKGVGEDLENLKYNTAISKLMVFVNKVQEVGCGQKEFGEFLILLSPFAPHLSEELWSQLGNHRSGGTGKESIFKQKWPKYDPKLVKDKTINLVVQINGKLRDTIEVEADISEDKAKKMALESGKIKKWIAGKKIVRVIFVKGKLVNIVIK